MDDLENNDLGYRRQWRRQYKNTSSWKCGFCEHVNDDNFEECSGCGKNR